jgi:homoserine O-acetyltransferase/O-succinyltransferase
MELLRGDVSRIAGGDLKEALGCIKAKTFVMPVHEDIFSSARLRSQKK